MAEHTEAKLKHRALMGVTDTPADISIFHCGLGLRGPVHTHEQAENARRLVACWNFCHGYSTEELEKGPPMQGRELIGAYTRIDKVDADRVAAATRADRLEVLLKRMRAGLDDYWVTTEEGKAVVAEANELLAGGK